MSPTLAPGDLLLVAAGRAPRPGDVVSFAAPSGQVITHRLVRLDRDVAVCRGDDRLTCDAPVRREAILGRAVAVVTPDGRPVRAVRGGRPALCRARLRRWLRMAPERGGHVGRELVLLVRQWRGAPGRDLPTDDAVAAMIAQMHIPAAVFSTLAPADRAALVARVLAAAQGDGELVVEGYAAGPGFRLARGFGRVRQALRGAGVTAGEPGDTALSPGPGLGAPYTHLFRADELRAALEAAGATVLGLERRAGPPEVLAARVTCG
jgi:hypothetical protein